MAHTNLLFALEAMAWRHPASPFKAPSTCTFLAPRGKDLAYLQLVTRVRASKVLSRVDGEFAFKLVSGALACSRAKAHEMQRRATKLAS